MGWLSIRGDQDLKHNNLHPLGSNKRSTLTSIELTFDFSDIAILDILIL